MHIGKKGFTLVEIIVSLAIMTIVAGAVGAFVIAGNNSYMRGNKELTLQEEAQLTANQLIDLIIDVERGIDFRTTTGQAVDVEGNTVADNVPVSELLLRNNDNVYMVRWQGQTAGAEYASANQLYLYEAANTKDADGKITAWGDPSDPSQATPSLMAEYVTAFNIDLTDLEKRKVKLEMTFVYQDKSYNVSETIKLRNDLSDEESDGYVWIEGLTIAPNPADVARGASQNFTYKFSGDSAAVKAATAQGVSWSVSKVDGSACNSSIDSDGKLSVALDEELGDGVLVVTCTSKADTTKVATAVVNVTEKKLNISLSITPKDGEVRKGDVPLEFTCIIDGDDDGSIAQAGVEWKLTYKDGTDTIYSHMSVKDNLKADLVVGGNEEIGPGILKVTCTSNADTSKSDYAYVTVSAVSGQYNTEIIANKITPYSYEENGIGRIGYKVDLECLTSWADYEKGYPQITWEVISPISDYAFEDTIPYSQYKTILDCKKNVGMTIKVRANVKLSANDWVFPERDIVIPQGATAKDGYSIGTNKDPYISSKQLVLFRNDKVTCKLENYTGDMSQVTWSIVNDVSEGLAEEKPLKDPKGSDEGMGRRVGFGLGGRDECVVPKEIIGGTADAKANTRNVFATATGEEVSIYAKWYINWNEEHILTVRASDKSGTIAETQVLIPRCEFYFSNGERYHNISKKQYQWGYYNIDKIFINVYGYTLGKGAFGVDDQALSVIMVLEGVKELKGNTFLGTGVRSADGKKSIVLNTMPGINEQTGEYAYQVQLYIDGQEENDTLYLKFIDSQSWNSSNTWQNKTMNERVTVIYWR